MLNFSLNFSPESDILVSDVELMGVYTAAASVVGLPPPVVGSASFLFLKTNAVPSGAMILATLNRFPFVCFITTASIPFTPFISTGAAKVTLK